MRTAAMERAEMAGYKPPLSGRYALDIDHALLGQ
jgi:hypothetical protein